MNCIVILSPSPLFSEKMEKSLIKSNVYEHLNYAQSMKIYLWRKCSYLFIRIHIRNHAST